MFILVAVRSKALISIRFIFQLKVSNPAEDKNFFNDNGL
jgi:hypothetical protein